MLVYPHQKSLYQFAGDFHAYLHAKKSTSLYFFFEIFQINSKFAILGNLGMSEYTHTVSIWKKLLSIYRVKIGFILHVFLEILQEYYELILRTLRMVGYITQSDIINLYKILLFICRQKINFIPYLLGGYSNNANLFWVLLVCLTNHTQNDKINM